MIPHDKILAVMERRFDHYSARVVLAEAMKAAGLSEQEKLFIPDQVRSLATALASVGSRVDAVVAALNDLANSEEAIATPAPVAEPAVTMEEVPVEGPTDTPLESPSEDAGDAEASPKKKKKR